MSAELLIERGIAQWPSLSRNAITSQVTPPAVFTSQVIVSHDDVTVDYRVGVGRNRMSRSLTVSWDDPQAAHDAGLKLSGIEYLRALSAGRIAVPPIMRLLGFRFAQVEEGLVVFECEPGEQHYNTIGVAHGGLAMTLLDSAMGCCVHTRLPLNRSYTTLEVKVNLVRAITAQTGTVRATGRVVHFGGKTATPEARLEDAAGKLYAHGTTTCIILGS